MKKRECNYCKNMVEDTEYSDMSELHKKDCPIREIMEFRIASDEAENKKTKAYLIGNEAVKEKHDRCGYCGGPINLNRDFVGIENA